MPKFIGRYQARLKGHTRYYTGRSCSRDHIAERQERDTKCVECAREDRKRRRRTNPEKRRAERRAYYARHREREQAKARERWLGRK